MATPQKTIGPLHFEDLEPHRFEDLVRQLIYDFRNWKALDGLGRSGSEQGFDVRGVEALPDTDSVDMNERDETEELSPGSERLWMIQCKREKYISPTKLVKYAKAIVPTDIYGVIFAACCDFSKKARDSFLSAMRTQHVQEVYLWGKAELEDMLFQPKNDHLLFAYFGFSLTIRRRSVRTEVRSTLSMKRKAITCLGCLRSEDRKPVLIRDANGSSYPFKDKGAKRSFHEAYFLGHYYDGIVCKVKEFFAHLDADKKHWDCLESFNDVEYDRFMGRFYVGDEREKRWKEREPIAQFWSKIPDENRALLEVRWYIPYQRRLQPTSAFFDIHLCAENGGKVTKKWLVLDASWTLATSL